METKEKLSFKEWFENLWYHYKWLLIFGAMFVIFIVVSCFQFFANANPDVYILHVGPMYISPAAAEKLETTVASFSRDYNDDGEINVGLLDITVNKFGNESAGIDPVNYDQNNSALQRFQTEIRAGDTFIYALDEEFFKICLEENLLTPLSEIIESEYLPETVIDGYGIPISDLDAYGLEGISSIPSTAILCLRRSPEHDDIKYGRTQENWEGNRDTFINIVKYRDGK